MKDLEARLTRWVRAGLVSEEQARAIRAAERAEREAPEESSLAATALGYLGASVALAGGVVAASREWADMGTGSRLALAAGATLLLLAAGWVVRRREHPALGSLDGFLWFLSAGGAAFTAGLVGHDVLDLEGRTMALLAGLVTALWALPLWRIRPAPLQEIAVVVGLAVFVEAFLHHLPGPPNVLHGLPLWGLGAIWALLAWGEVLPDRRRSFALAGVALLLGAQILSFGWRDVGLVLGIGTAVALLAASVGLKSMLPLGFGAAGVLLFLPQIVFEYLGDTLGAPLALLVVGGALLGAAFLTARLRGTVREGKDPTESRAADRHARRLRALVAAVGIALAVAVGVWVFGVAPLPDYPSLAARPDPSIPGRVAFLRWGTRPCLYVVPASGGDPRRLRCASRGEGDADWLGGPVGWTRGGRIVVQAFGPSGPRALVLDPETGRLLERIQVDEPLLARPLTQVGSGGPEDARLLVNRSDGEATLGIASHDSSPREIARVSGPQGYTFWEALWSPDGEWILIRDSNQNLLIVRAQEGAPVRILADRVSGPFAWHVRGLPAHTVDLDSLRATAR
ncbi:MAG: DUF2157 domain-containing protein [Gemmatimonadota bacterium]